MLTASGISFYNPLLNAAFHRTSLCGDRAKACGCCCHRAGTRGRFPLTERTGSEPGSARPLPAAGLARGSVAAAGRLDCRSIGPLPGVAVGAAAGGASVFRARSQRWRAKLNLSRRTYNPERVMFDGSMRPPPGRFAQRSGDDPCCTGKGCGDEDHGPVHSAGGLSN